MKTYPLHLERIRDDPPAVLQVEIVRLDTGIAPQQVTVENGFGVFEEPAADTGTSAVRHRRHPTQLISSLPLDGGACFVPGVWSRASAAMGAGTTC